MSNYPADFWNDRYRKDEFVYGVEPNHYLRNHLSEMQPGKILLPAEGEGRNAIFAARSGWDVKAFDISEEGFKKAKKLAEKNRLEIKYEVTDVLNFDTDEKFDVLAFIYAHFPNEIRARAISHLLKFLKPGGKVIFEAFSKKQLGNDSGGPKNPDMLYSIEEVKNEFQNLEFEYLAEETIDLDEGVHHQGKGSVIRFVGTKIK